MFQWWEILFFEYNYYLKKKLDDNDYTIPFSYQLQSFYNDRIHDTNLEFDWDINENRNDRCF